MKVDFSRLKPWIRHRWEPEQRPWTLTGLFVLLWCIAWLDWTAWHRLPDLVVWLIFSTAAYPLWYWYQR
ncbi:MAG: hypothetical protein ACI97B_004915, partial [Verrucomicrobiales bacterium]